MKYTSAHVSKNKRSRGWRGFLSYKEDGVWKKDSKSFKEAKTKTEAKRMLAEWREEMELQATITPVQDDVISYAYDLVTYKANHGAISRSTVRDYNLSIKSWTPYLEKIALKDLTRHDIEQALADMLKTTHPNTVIKRYIALNMVLEHAVEVSELLTNPMKGIPKPKRIKSLPNSIVGEELERVKARLAALDLKPWVVGVYLCLYAGLRIEEACGLRHTDIDLKHRVGWVRQVVAVGEGGSYIAPPKTKKPRDFRLSAALVEILESWVKEQSALFAEAEENIELDTPLLAVPGQKIVEPRRIGRYWSMLAEIEGFKGQEGRKPTLHDLRHTFATACVKSGMDIKTLQSLLGHASAAMTLDTYASADPIAKDNALSIIDAAI